MKKKLTAPAVLLLTAPLLTGCWGSGYYETAHFRIDGSLPWTLSDAEYDADTNHTGLLRFQVPSGDVTVREYAFAIPEEAAADTGEIGAAENASKDKEYQCKYHVFQMNTGAQGYSPDSYMRDVTVYVDTDGWVLELHTVLQQGSLPGFETDVQKLLDLLEYTG